MLDIKRSYARNEVKSGLDIGENCPAFDPVHVWGPDKGTSACPMCKYGTRTTGVMAWLTDDNWDNASQLAVFLEKQIQRRGAGTFKAFLIYTNPDNRPAAEVNKRLTDFSRAYGLRELSVVYVPSVTDTQTSGLYRINPKARNTIMVYHKRTVADKFINLSATYDNLNKVLTSINRVAPPMP